MGFGWEVYAAGMFGALFAGISKGGFGSGAAFASATILALFVPPGVALGIMLPLLMLIDAATLRPYWRQWSWSDAKLLVLGGLPGVALGAALYEVAEPDLFRLLIGAVALLFVAWQGSLALGLLRLGQREIPRWGGALAGVVAGFTSFVSHAGGPAVAVYLLSRRIGKTPFQATTVLVFGLLNLAKLVPFAALGIFTRETLLFDLLMAPFALIGAWLGVRAHRVVPERAFFAVTYVLLMVTGAKLIWDALT
ncbi:MAG: sulfite exporter TauE/SafE family protein [Roseovarius sp.]